jgi:hypothetical protein
MTSWKPVPKMTAAALGGALATLLVWVLGALDVEVPAEAASALAAVLAFAAGYIKAPGEHDSHSEAGAVSVIELLLIVLVVVVLLAVLGVLPR